MHFTTITFDFRADVQVIDFSSLRIACSSGLPSPDCVTNETTDISGAVNMPVQVCLPSAVLRRIVSEPSLATTSCNSTRLRRMSSSELISFSRDGSTGTVWLVVAVGSSPTLSLPMRTNSRDSDMYQRGMTTSAAITKPIVPVKNHNICRLWRNRTRTRSCAVERLALRECMVTSNVYGFVMHAIFSVAI